MVILLKAGRAFYGSLLAALRVFDGQPAAGWTNIVRSSLKL